MSASANLRRLTARVDDHPAATPEAIEGLLDILDERVRQQQKWDPDGVPGQWSLSTAERVSILTEELGEVASAVNDGDPIGARAELVQVAAVALRWLESFRSDDFRPLEG
jgi:NTP pyrophosphatase (non-canonical NTP hydrolase)